MATLSTEDRQKIWRGLMRATDDFGWSGLKGDLWDAIVATDAWINTNGASFNAALPDTFRSNASLEQKTLVFCAVAAARASIDMLRKLFGGVD